MLNADYVFGAAVLFVIGCNLYFGPRINSERIAMQWGLDGRPTWYAPKQLALWGIVVFMLAVRAFIGAAATYAPQSGHGVEVGIVGFSLVTAGVHVFTLTMASKAN
jgi:hypothetical protein